MSYHEACRNGVLKHSSTDQRIHHGNIGFILSVSPAILQLIHDYGFFQILRGTSFDAALAWVAYCRTYVIDWSRHMVKDVFFLYDWDSTEVFGFSEITHVVPRQGLSENVTLRAKPFEWNKGT